MKKISVYIVLFSLLFMFWWFSSFDSEAAVEASLSVTSRVYPVGTVFTSTFRCPDGWVPFIYQSSPYSMYAGFYNSNTKEYREKVKSPYTSGDFYAAVTSNGSVLSSDSSFYASFNPSDFSLNSNDGVALFSSRQALLNYLNDGSLDSGSSVPTPPIDYNPLNYDYDSRVEAPVVQFDTKNSSFSFVNGSDGIGVTAYCRWLSVNDIYLDFDSSNLSGAFNELGSLITGKDKSFATYSSVVKSSFVEAIPVTDGQPSTSKILLYRDLSGSSPFMDSFNDLISVYPPSQRSIDGKLSVNHLTGNNYAWFDNASAALRESLASPKNSLSVPEIYFRFYQVIDNQLCFSRWTKFTMPLSMENYSHDWTTYIDNEYGNDVAPPIYNTGVVDSNEPIVNNAPVSVGTNTQNTVSVNTQSNTVDINIQSVDWSQYIKTFQSSLGLFGNFTAFVTAVFTFLPSWIIAMLGSTVTLLCGLAVYHGIRG